MKRIFVTLLMASGITSPFVTRLAAQSNSAHADIPFAFVVSNHTLRAGKYTVSELRAGSPIFSLRNSEGQSILVQLPINKDGKAQQPSLTFACYGNEHVLAQATPPDSPIAYGLTQSSIDKQLPHRLGMAPMISIKLGSR